MGHVMSMREVRNAYKIAWKSEINYLRERDVDDGITLKWILKKQCKGVNCIVLNRV
jgi:hypothetical protein